MHLSDPDEGWGEHPVDSTYHACCHSIGVHAPACPAGLLRAASAALDEAHDRSAQVVAVLEGARRTRANQLIELIEQAERHLAMIVGVDSDPATTP